MAECGNRLGGTITYPCELPPSHEGPCMSTDNPQSVRVRTKWEKGEPAWQADPEKHRPMEIEDVIEKAVDKAEAMSGVREDEASPFYPETDFTPALVIGVTGYAYTGKDTIGQMLVDDFGFTRVAFASAVRDVALTINPWIVDLGQGDGEPSGGRRLSRWVEKEGWDNAKRHVEVRRLLQVIGTEVGRTMIDPDIWVNMARQRIQEGELQKVVITDVRFPNEADFIIEEMGGVLFAVTRPDHGPVNDHSSESFFTELADRKGVIAIENNGDLGDLKAKVSYQMGKLEALKA